MLGIIIGVGAVLILVSVVQGYNADLTAYYEKQGVNKVSASPYMETVIASVEDWMGENFNTNRGSCSVENGNDAMNAAEDETASLQVVLGGVAGIALLVGIIGIFLGYAGSLLAGKLIYDLILFPEPRMTLAAFLFSLLIGVGFGMYPAVKASGLQPVDALRAD